MRVFIFCQYQEQDMRKTFFVKLMKSFNIDYKICTCVELQEIVLKFNLF